jgi:hypothetical protein
MMMKSSRIVFGLLLGVETARTCGVTNLPSRSCTAVDIGTVMHPTVRFETNHFSIGVHELTC